MPTPNLTLENGSFVDFEGNPLANGYLLMELSHDEQYSASNYQVVAGLKIKITLDASGNINPTVKVFSNDTLLPVGSYYIVRAFRSDGANAWADFQYWTLSSSPNPLDVGTIVPSNPPSSGSGGGSSSVLLQTNGVSNTVQNVENLISGAGISLTADSLGGTTIATTGTGGTATTNFRVWRPDSSGSLASGSFGVGMALTSNAASLSLVTATATEPIMYSFLNQGPNDGGCYVLADGDTGGPTYPASYGVAKLLKVRFQNPVVQSTSTWRNWIGWSDGWNSSLVDDPSTTHTVAFRYVLSLDGTTWHAYCSNGAASTVVDTGITMDTNPHTFQIATTSSSAVFSIDGTAVATISSDIPATTTQIWPIIQEEWKAGGMNFHMYIGGIYTEMSGGW